MPSKKKAVKKATTKRKAAPKVKAVGVMAAKKEGVKPLKVSEKAIKESIAVLKKGIAVKKNQRVGMILVPILFEDDKMKTAQVITEDLTADALFSAIMNLATAFENVTHLPKQIIGVALLEE